MFDQLHHHPGNQQTHSNLKRPSPFFPEHQKQHQYNDEYAIADICKHCEKIIKHLIMQMIDH
jgi:hypothetical protein